MSKNSFGLKGADPIQMQVRKFRDFDVSWAGQGRRSGEYCLGSEDGRILITDESLNPIGFLQESAIPSGEAINGVAFLNDVIGVSTRCEVVFASRTPVNGKGFRSVLPAGAHSVLAISPDYFVAPLGHSGVMVLKPSAEKEQALAIWKAPNMPFNFYKTVNLPCVDGAVLACAARLDGVATIPFLPDGTRSVSSLTYPGLDVVDVCSLGHNLPAPAIAAISRDCTLILSRDALHDATPTTIKFDELKGIAYRLLNYDGNLLILTSSGIYLLSNLGRRYIYGEPVGTTPTLVKAITLEAVDANIAEPRSLLVVVPDGVILIDLDLLISAGASGEQADGVQEARPTETSPQWQPHTNAVEFEIALMASVA